MIAKNADNIGMICVFDANAPIQKKSLSLVFKQGTLLSKRMNQGPISLLFIGANNMQEIEQYAKQYKEGLFIEAIPQVYSQLRRNLQTCNERHGTQFQAVKALVSDEEGKDSTFHVFDNNGASSSLFKANQETWKWSAVKEIYELTLRSTTIESLLREYAWDSKEFDVVLDVQGAELLVLKGFGQENLKHMQSLKVEISKVPYYEGGVLFDKLHAFLVANGFQLDEEPANDHCDVVYSRVKA